MVLGLCLILTRPLIPMLSKLAKIMTAINDGRDNQNRLRILTLPAKNIINVVTSPVIKDTPPELTANTTSTAKRIVLLGGKLSDSTKVIATKVAVMLSANDENKKLKIAVKKSSFRSLIDSGIARCKRLSIKPFLFR